MNNPINARQKHQRAKMIKQLISEHEQKKKSDMIGMVTICASFLAIGIVITLMVV